MNFFIFSLPRSGSAWLSVFLTHGPAFCYHEPLAESQTLSVLFSRPGIVGAIDTLAYTQAVVLRQQYRCFVLKRDIAEIESSSARCGVTYRAPQETFARATAGLTVIDYRYFRDIKYLAHIWWSVVGDDFDAARAQQLMEMNIQRDLPRIITKVPTLAHCIAQKSSV